jgi:hypothetical protein
VFRRWFQQFLRRFSRETPRETAGHVQPDVAGVRNKNPLNVKGGVRWKGKVGQDARGHAKFESEAWGTRAAIINLRSYWTKHRLRSVIGILQRWAPVTDTIGSIEGNPANQPHAYADFVAKRSGLPRNSSLSLFDSYGRVQNPDQLYRLVEAMSVYENGHGYRFDRKWFDAALELV